MDATAELKLAEEYGVRGRSDAEHGGINWLLLDIPSGKFKSTDVCIVCCSCGASLCSFLFVGKGFGVLTVGQCRCHCQRCVHQRVWSSEIKKAAVDLIVVPKQPDVLLEAGWNGYL